jgi:hypothetical protein
VECPQPWCDFRYTKGRGTTHGLGCTKFSTDAVRAYPDLPDTWERTSWRDLHNVLLAALADRLRADGLERPRHKHGPPVGHARKAED